jgi:anti-sigma factor RsiW
MTCREYEPLLALYVEGDLDDRKVEQHLAECAHCRELLVDLQASQAMLKDLSSGAVDAALLSAVRSGVLSKTRPRRVWHWVAACAAVAVLVALIPSPGRPPSQHVAIANEPAIANQFDGGADPPVLVRTSAPAHKDRRGRRRQIRGLAPPLVVKMLTDDPNIVIIWLVDQPGD